MDNPVKSDHFKACSAVSLVRVFLGIVLGLGLLAGTAYAATSDPFPPESFGAALFLFGGLAIVLWKKLKQKISERENNVVPV